MRSEATGISQKTSQAIALALEESRIYRDYKKAFTRATGLPLQIKTASRAMQTVRSEPKINPFCALLAKSNQACAACVAMQQKLEEEAQMEPKTLKCFAGLYETAVPIRVGNNLIAFLETGQILLSRPDSVKFHRVAKALVQWGTDVDLKRAEEAYFGTRVLSPVQYESMVQLLTIFAEHLAACGQHLLLQVKAKEPASVATAKRWIDENSRDDISLASVAGAVNMSASYFSETFREVTGLTFVDYVARVRVEKARGFLENPSLRISEIAFDVGFQSLSQFNRSFKKCTGVSPKEWRALRVIS